VPSRPRKDADVMLRSYECSVTGCGDLRHGALSFASRATLAAASTVGTHARADFFRSMGTLFALCALLRTGFECPRCGLRAATSILRSSHVVGSRHLHRSVPSAHRIAKVGVDPHPSPRFPRRQPRYKRYRRIAKRIRTAERELLDQLSAVNSDLERHLHSACAGSSGVRGRDRTRNAR
jgi:hypothetical protein